MRLLSKRLLRAELYLHEILDRVPSGVIVTDRYGRIEIVNPAATRMFGYGLNEVLPLSTDQLMSETQAEKHYAPIQNHRNSEMRKVHGSGFRSWQGKRKDGTFFPVEMAIDELESKDERHFLIIARDITERAYLKSELDRREREFRALVENSPDIIARFDRALRFIYVNPAIERVLGRPASSFPGKTYEDLELPDDLVRCLQSPLKNVFASGKEQIAEFVLPSPDGEQHFQSRHVPELSPDGTVHSVLLNCRDITVLKKTEFMLREREQEIRDSRRLLQRLAAHRENLREEEKKRIAREIHDELGQILTAMKMDISFIRMNFLQNHSELAKKIQALGVLVNRAVQVVRNISTDLRPSALDFGIAAALEWLVKEFETRTGIPCVLTTMSDIVLDEQLAIAIFRIAQESLNNVAKHANARHASVLLVSRNDHIRVEIQDDGCGFDVTAEHKPKSFGLLGIRERVSALGGKFDIHSTPGKGTRLAIRLPPRSSPF